MTKTILILLASLALQYNNFALAEKSQYGLVLSQRHSISFISGQPRRRAMNCVTASDGGGRHQQETTINTRMHPQQSTFIFRRQEEASSSHLQATTTTSTTTQADGDTAKPALVWTMDDLDAFALSEGIELSKSTLGPGFRTVARSAQNSSRILGYGEGFVRPAGDILHLDKMEVFQKMVDAVKAENPDFRGGGTTFGVGLLFGYQCLLHGSENGCIDAEFLAIDDEDFQHRRLVRFYKYAGFKVIKYIGDDFQDIPARMVWGGCGTLMRAKIDDLLPFWTMLLSRKSSSK